MQQTGMPRSLFWGAQGPRGGVGGWTPLAPTQTGAVDPPLNLHLTRLCRPPSMRSPVCHTPAPNLAKSSPLSTKEGQAQSPRSPQLCPLSTFPLFPFSSLSSAGPRNCPVPHWPGSQPFEPGQDCFCRAQRTLCSRPHSCLINIQFQAGVSPGSGLDSIPASSFSVLLQSGKATCLGGNLLGVQECFLEKLLLSDNKGHA